MVESLREGKEPKGDSGYDLFKFLRDARHQTRRCQTRDTFKDARRITLEYQYPILLIGD